MADSAIEWTGRVWNPIAGCSIHTPGCTNCYAMRMAARLEAMGQAAYVGLTTKTKAGPVWNGKVRLVESALTKPLTWRKPQTIFVNSMSDLFHEDVPFEWVDRVFAVMALTPQHTYQILTKRPDRMRAWLAEKWQGTPAQRIDFADGTHLDVPTGGETGRRYQVEQACEPFLQEFGLVDTTRDELWTADGSSKAMQWSWPLPNVWLGASVEDQVRADERQAPMAEIAAAGWQTFVSYEPALSHVAWAGWEFLRWIICGGESGPKARWMHPICAREARDFCAEWGIAFFFKQWGTYAWVEKVEGDPSTLTPYRAGKKAAGRLLDGRLHDDMPARAA